MQYTIHNVAPNVYMFEVEKAYDLAMLFCRVQEFYENSDPQFRKNRFSLLKFMDWYAKTYSPDGVFSYPEDFSGFNVPGTVVFECYSFNTDLNPYDKIIFDAAVQIAQIQGNSNFYLIGVKVGDKATAAHEIAHGLFHTNPQYKQQMLDLVNKLPNKKKLCETLRKKYMYDSSVLDDEVHAYLATGLIEGMETYIKHQKPFVTLFKLYQKQHEPKIVLQQDVDLF